MGLIQHIKQVNNINLALQVSNYYHGDLVSAPIQVSRFIKAHNGVKKDALLAAIGLCGIPETSKQLYIISNCYLMLGAQFRTQAIIYLLQYIDAGAVWEGTPRCDINIDGHIINQLDLNRSSTYCELGKAYEGEYQFSNALYWYQQALKINPTSSPAVCYIADVYVKMNDIDAGLRFLRDVKKSAYKDIKLIAGDKIKELREKKSNGYVYKPRPRKRAANCSQPIK